MTEEAGVKTIISRPICWHYRAKSKCSTIQHYSTVKSDQNDAKTFNDDKC